MDIPVPEVTVETTYAYDLEPPVLLRHDYLGERWMVARVEVTISDFANDSDTMVTHHAYAQKLRISGKPDLRSRGDDRIYPNKQFAQPFIDDAKRRHHG